MALDRLYVTLAICALLLGTHVVAWIHGRNHERDAQEQKAKVIELAQVKAAAAKEADTAHKEAVMRETQTGVVHVLQTQTITLAGAVDASAAAATERLRVLASRSASRCVVPQSAGATSGSDAGQTTVAAILRDADRSDLVAVGAAADRALGEQVAMLGACRKLLREAWRMTN